MVMVQVNMEAHAGSLVAGSSMLTTPQPATLTSHHQEGSIPTLHTWLASAFAASASPLPSLPSLRSAPPQASDEPAPFCLVFEWRLQAGAPVHFSLSLLCLEFFCFLFPSPVFPNDLTLVEYHILPSKQNSFVCRNSASKRRKDGPPSDKENG